MCPSLPPSGSSTAPLPKSLGSVEAPPSERTIQPSGIPLPRAWASLILPAATAEVAMSISTGSPRADGTAIAIGLVPSRASAPPNGATLFGERPESAVIMAMKPAFAAMVG